MVSAADGSIASAAVEAPTLRAHGFSQHIRAVQGRLKGRVDGMCGRENPRQGKVERGEVEFFIHIGAFHGRCRWRSGPALHCTFHSMPDSQDLNRSTFRSSCRRVTAPWSLVPSLPDQVREYMVVLVQRGARCFFSPSNDFLPLAAKKAVQQFADWLQQPASLHCLAL